MSVASLLFRLRCDALAYFGLLFRPRESLASEIRFLRKPLALYQERKSSRKPTDPATRFTMVVLSQRFDWRDALVIVKPRTLVRWHRLGFRMLWHYKSRPGRPPIPLQLQQLIREMAYFIGRRTNCE